MIFVTLGTQDKPFHRLLKNLDVLIQAGYIKDRIIVQAGCTKYESSHMEIIDFIDMNKFNEYIDQCDFMITHAGVGTIINGINHGKRVMAVARRAKYGEHENDHQVEITTKFMEMGYIVGCLDADEMMARFSELENFQTKPYVSNNYEFCSLIYRLMNS